MLSEAWIAQAESAQMMDYLLLADARRQSPQPLEKVAVQQTDSATQATDSGDFHGIKRLVLELLYPKVEELLEACESWVQRGRNGGSGPSQERAQSIISLCIVGAILTPEFTEVNSRQSQDIGPALAKLIDTFLKVIVDSSDNAPLFETIYRQVRPHLSGFSTAELTTLCTENKPLLTLFATLSRAIRAQSSQESNGHVQGSMDPDDDFESQATHRSLKTKQTEIPRYELSLRLSQSAFYNDTEQRLRFLAVIDEDEGQVGLVPPQFIDELVALPDEEFLLCRLVLQDLLSEDLVISPDDALKVLGKVGNIISGNSYRCCEVVLSFCIDLIRHLSRVWSDERHEISSSVGDLYNYFVKVARPKNMLSPAAQIAMARLLLHLLKVNPGYGESLGMPTCRATLISIMEDGDMVVKHFIGSRLPDIFAFYVLKDHDSVFVEILNALPNNTMSKEGIAFRLYVFAELACRWPTLLRRCIYHIFETPGEAPDSVPYAKCCLEKTAAALNLKGPQDIFALFAPQVLYTWLESKEIGDIPFQIFGFQTLGELLAVGKSEASAILMMRGQDHALSTLVDALGVTTQELIKSSFSKILAYCIGHDISTPGAGGPSTGEARVRKVLGREAFAEAIYLNFVDIIAILFDVLDQESPIENAFAKEDSLKYAADIMAEIKKLGHSDVRLPPNQQPFFRGKYLVRELAHLCSRTHYEMSTLWTPTLVVYVARKLLSTVHPALGSLHACSVLRKVRVLVCLAGEQATTSYTVEMLLHSIRPYIVDSECADDALGLTQYLLSRGSRYLQQSPSFLAGFALSTLASLRVFLESSQSSTSLESQFRATMGKARQFHSWFSKYLAEYKSNAFKDPAQAEDFKSIIQSATFVRSSGNAEKGTHESTLLLEILRDQEREDHLLNESARELALGLLCGDFKIPSPPSLDAIDTDELAVTLGTAVWKSCRSHLLSKDYLAWAGRVVGRSFAASGAVHQDLLRESQMSTYLKLATDSNGSIHGILRHLELLTTHRDCATAGLAEAALRTVVSSIVGADEYLTQCTQQSLSDALFKTSNWGAYNIPPMDTPSAPHVDELALFGPEGIALPGWSQSMAAYLAGAVPATIILSVLPPILQAVERFAEQTFPFVVHLVLLSDWGSDRAVKKRLSGSLKHWLKSKGAGTVAAVNVKLLLNTILYLRSQEIPKESSLADRNRWLDIDFWDAAAAARDCGMFKSALLFAELAFSEDRKTSRRSGTARDLESSDLLLEIFENIDDPDAYYGLPQPASLGNVLARMEYEKDGSKSLAFRGAQYDTNLRRRNPNADADARSLVSALSTLGLSGLSQSLLQTHQRSDASSSSLETIFRTARRLEIWNIPAQSSTSDPAVTLYKAYQSVHQATDLSSVRIAVHRGLGNVMRNLATTSLTATKLRDHLGALAVLTEMDDVFNVLDLTELEAVFQRFQSRSRWMMSGR